MAFRIDTADQWLERVRQAFRAYLPGTDAWLWPNNVYVAAKVIGGLAHGYGGTLDYIQKQAFAITADREHLMLMAEDFNIGTLTAEASTGTVQFTASTALSVDTGAILARSDGVQYEVAQGGSIGAAGVLVLSVVAVLNGKTANADPGVTLTPVSGVTGTSTIAVTTGGIQGGRDDEDTESLRERILFRKRNPPRGGAPSDYVIWGLEVPGVTRVFVERTFNGGGTVRVYPLFDNAYADGIAPSTEIDIVREHIQALAPAGALVTVQAPLRFPINIVVAGLNPSTDAVKNAVREELKLAVLRQSRVSGSNAPHPAMPYLATPLIFSRSWLWQAVANAAGEQAHQLLTPASDMSIPISYIPALGTVTFA